MVHKSKRLLRGCSCSLDCVAPCFVFRCCSLAEGKSGRQTMAVKYKIQKKVKEHNKKMRRNIRDNPNFGGCLVLGVGD